MMKQRAPFGFVVVQVQTETEQNPLEPIRGVLFVRDH